MAAQGCRHPSRTKEHELFGSEGFEGVIATFGEIERAYGIFDLNPFTPIF